MSVAKKAEGVILRKYYLRETSYILVVFTREYGKIRGVIKGVRKPYPQFAGAFEIFTRCDLLFYRKKRTSLDLITQCDAAESFVNARKEIERLTYANYFIELIDTIINEYDPDQELYDVLIHSLRMLDRGEQPARTGRVFELKVLKATGLNPPLDRCSVCNALDIRGGVFSLNSGGMVCSVCRDKARDLVPVSRGTMRYMRKIQSTDMSKTTRIRVDRKVAQETEALLRSFLRYHVKENFRSLEFLDKLYGAGIA